MRKKILKMFLVCIGVLILMPFLIIGFYKLFPAKIHNQTVGGFSLGFLPLVPSQAKIVGLLIRDEIWSGEIFVPQELILLPWVKLEVQPGTVVKFKHSRAGEKGVRPLFIQYQFYGQGWIRKIDIHARS